MKYRFQWTYPILLSPHDPNVLYVTGNRVFRSTNEGTNWEIISPDLTRNDVSKMEPSGGPITRDGAGADVYCTIFAFAESPHERGVFWAGSDDGLVHLSRDGGQTWENVTPPGLPEWATVAIIEVSAHDAATAYVAAYRYKLDDYHPYLFKTTDYGATWQQITNGIPEQDFTRVIREDPVRRGLLYAGTETGLYLSFDAGVSWQRFQANLPVVPIYDLVIKDDDLVACTHGRSFWILDDVTPLRQLSDAIAQAPAHLFTPRRSCQDVRARGFADASVLGWMNYKRGAGGGVAFSESQRPDGSTSQTHLDAGDNPPRGVTVTYFFKDKPAGEVTLTFQHATGEEIRSFGSRREGELKPTGPPQQWVRAEQGLNRFVWDMRYPAPTQLPEDPTLRGFRGPDQGPEVPPGPYQVRLTIGDQVYAESFEIAKDSRIAATQEQLEERFKVLLRIRDKLSETNEAVLQLRSIRQQVEEWERRAEGRTSAIAEAAQRLKGTLSGIEEELIQTRLRTRVDHLRYPVKLNGKLRAVAGVVESTAGTVPQQAYDVSNQLSARVDGQLKRLQGTIDEDLERFKDLLLELEVPLIVPRRSV